MRLVSKLPALIEEYGLNQSRLADATGLSPTTVGKIFRGHFRQIDTNTIVTLCSFFELESIADLFEIEHSD